MTDAPRTALVTGTSSGFGRGVAEQLVALGWEVLGTVRGDVTGVPFDTVRCDVTDDDAVARVGDEVMKRWGRLDALINNAGSALMGPVEELEPSELRAHLDVNLVAPLAMVRACLPALRQARGVVVQVSSASGYVADGLWAPYNAGKFGLEGASEALALEVADQGVRVVLVEPGGFRTEIASKSPRMAALGTTGHYEPMWTEVQTWLEWLAHDSPHPQPVIDAIVAAASHPDAPMRIPVGEGMCEELRRKGQQLIDQANAADEFLRTIQSSIDS